LGQARASARLASPPWNQVQQLLREFDMPGPPGPGLKVKDQAHALALKVLTEEALAANSASDPRPLLELLIKLRQPVDLSVSLDRWEHDAVTAVGQRVISDLLAGLEHRSPADVLAIVNRILQVDPHHLATLLVKAEAQARSGDFKGSK